MGWNVAGTNGPEFGPDPGSSADGLWAEAGEIGATPGALDARWTPAGGPTETPVVAPTPMDPTTPRRMMAANRDAVWGKVPMRSICRFEVR